ncbi:MAG TPA: TMEM165/GDT1 family protein [Pseudonocardiaceae bacterium]
MISLSVLGVAFALVLPVELPDKTLVATMLLATRYRPGPVLLGVCAAFAVQCVLAVAFGSVLTLLPERVVAGVVAVLFAAGAAVLLRESFRADPPSSDEDGDAVGGRAVPAMRAAGISFGVLFAAEFGDASQLATAALTARYGAPLSVGLGAWLALALIATVAVLVGGRLGDRLPRRLLQRVSGVVFLTFALVAAWEAL